MTRWRRIAIQALLAVSGSEVPACLRLYRELETASPVVVAEFQRRKLLHLLRHCRTHVPWYRRLIDEHGIDLSDAFVPEELRKLPLLTKDLLREQATLLKSDDADRRRTYVNSSGGSTGRPVVFTQDAAYHARSVVAAKLIYNEFLGKRPGEPEMNLWGSETDVHRGSAGWKKRLVNFIYNRRFQNFFVVDDAKLQRFVEEINRCRPVSIWAYVQSLDLLAKFVRRRKLAIHSPRLIIATAGTLHEGVRRSVEDVFRCPVYNQYGCREVGAIAFEMHDQNGLRGLPYLNHVEIVEGRIVVTNLTNYSMPLVRYDLQDLAEPWRGPQDERFGCRHKILQTVTGRVHSHFRTTAGSFVHGGFFAHQFWFADWVREFQVVQNGLDHVTCHLVLADEPPAGELDRIRAQIRGAMGAACAVEFCFRDRIPPSPSGKHMYTISRL